MSSLPGIFQKIWSRLAEFSGLRGDATFLWTRWLVLRAIGVVFVFVFAGIVVQAQALLAPNGIAQLAETFEQLQRTFPSFAEQLIRAPSLFWVSKSPAMISLLGWAGLAAALALVLNLWPRGALFGCWLLFLSFASTWRTFSPAQLDNLMLETALLCLPFAPAGWRPGLGAKSPPRPIALFMMRWLLFRVMFEAGIVKLTAGDPHWRDFSAMDLLYETAPFPTILGFLDHQLPRWYHVLEIVLTFAAELLAPLAAVFAGRRGRWFAFFTWTLLQVGIQITSNFGWLNAAAIGLGLLLLDDQMVAAAADKLRLRWLAERLRGAAVPMDRPAITGWSRYALPAVLWVHFYLGLFYFARACGADPNRIPRVLAGPVHLVREFRSVNGFFLYATFEPVRYQVEFLGSNDGGRTWRVYEYRNIPQHPDRVCGFLAPWFSRFEATLEIEGWSGRKSPVFPAVAGHLLAGNPNVLALFARNPFPDRPPALLRMRGYRLAFADYATWRRTGQYWRRELDGDYAPMLARDDEKGIVEFSLAAGEAALAARDLPAALAIFSRQYEAGFQPAGFRLAEMKLRGLGGADPAGAFALYTRLAAEGEVVADYYLGVCHERGLGTPADVARAASLYRRAADRGYLPALFAVGRLHATEQIERRFDSLGLAALLEAGDRAKGEDPAARYVRENQPALVQRMLARMSPADIAAAKERAAKAPPRRTLRP